MMQTYYAIGL